MVNRKQHIAQVALQLFGERGVENTPTAHIAKAAGVSEALIFKYFGSKELLLDLLVKTGYQRTIERNRGWLDEPDPLRLVQKVVELPHRLVQEDPHFWQLQSRLTELASARGQYERFMQPVTGLLRRAFQALGYPEPDKEASLLLLLVEALWRIQARKTATEAREMMEFIQQKYMAQVAAR